MSCPSHPASFWYQLQNTIPMFLTKCCRPSTEGSDVVCSFKCFLSINMTVAYSFSLFSIVASWKSAKIYLLQHRRDVRIVYRITSFHMILDLMFQENRKPDIVNLRITSSLPWRWIHVKVIRSVKRELRDQTQNPKLYYVSVQNS